MKNHFLGGPRAPIIKLCGQGQKACAAGAGGLWHRCTLIGGQLRAAMGQRAAVV